MEVRFPRTLAAAILGGALALSGYLLQTFFHNPIAGPFILGISSGAKLVVALTMVFMAGNVAYISSLMMIGASFIGAMISMGFVLLISRVLNQMSMLIVGGVMIGYICSAITDFVVTFAEDADIVNLHNWSRGSFSGIDWDNVVVMTVVIAITVLCVFLLSKPISAYQMGESYAQNMGLNIKLFRGLLVLLSSILSAAVTAFAGACFLCRYRRTSSGQRTSQDHQANSDDSGLLSGRRRILPVVRPAGQSAVCAG